MTIECVRCEREFDTDREPAFSLASTWRCSFCGKDNSALRNRDTINSDETKNESEIITDTVGYTKKYDDKQVYVMSSGEKIKVGISNDPKQRISDFRTANPEISLEFVYETRFGHGVEQDVHSSLSEYEVRNEWFEVEIATGINEVTKTSSFSSRLSERIV